MKSHEVRTERRKARRQLVAGTPEENQICFFPSAVIRYSLLSARSAKPFAMQPSSAFKIWVFLEERICALAVSQIFSIICSSLKELFELRSFSISVSFFVAMYTKLSYEKIGTRSNVFFGKNNRVHGFRSF